MRLSWRNPDGIARALQQAYPETDRLALTPAALKALAGSLPGFSDAADGPPDENTLNDVLWRWMRHAGNGRGADEGALA